MLPKMSKKCLQGLARHADPGQLGEKMSHAHTGSEGSSHQMSHCQLELGRPFHNMSHTPLVREGAPSRRHVNNRVPGTDPTEGPTGPWEPCCERVTGRDRPGWPVAVPQMAIGPTGPRACPAKHLRQPRRNAPNTSGHDSTPSEALRTSAPPPARPEGQPKPGASQAQSMCPPSEAHELACQTCRPLFYTHLPW